MGRLRRRMRLEQLESRSLLAATIGIPDLIVDPKVADGQVVASIEIENAAGIRGATVEIVYDQTLLQADLSSIRAGSIWDGKGVAIANVNDSQGMITAFVFATEDMSLSSGSLLDIDFVFTDDTTGTARASIDVASLRINEGEIAISAVPIQGQTAINGSITRKAVPVDAGWTDPRQAVAPPSDRAALAVARPSNQGVAAVQPVAPRPWAERDPVVTLRRPAAQLASAATTAANEHWVCTPASSEGALSQLPATQPASGDESLLGDAEALNDQPTMLPLAPVGPAAQTQQPQEQQPQEQAMVVATVLAGVAASEAVTTAGLPAAVAAAADAVQGRADDERIGAEGPAPLARRDLSPAASFSGFRRGFGGAALSIWLLSGRRAEPTGVLAGDAPPAEDTV